MLQTLLCSEKMRIADLTTSLNYALEIDFDGKLHRSQMILYFNF